jgi:uncharacterized protein involved in exopolysaccharide biosynthesis
VIIAIIVIAISKYARNDLFTVDQKRYKKEAITNLEASKASLIQETPTVQIVDSPVFPLEKSETKWYMGLLIGLFISFFSSILYFLVFKTSL